MWPQFVWWKKRRDFKFVIPNNRGSSITTLGAISSNGGFHYRTENKTTIDTVMNMLTDMQTQGTLHNAVFVMDRHRSHMN